jgi:hypothetical protein
LEGINGLYVFSLLCYYATLTAAATKTKPIGDDADRRFTIIVNSASTAVPIGLPPKMAEFCHTPNRLLLGRQCHRALLRLYFNSSATGLLVRNKGCPALGGSLQKDNYFVPVFLFWPVVQSLVRE